MEPCLYSSPRTFIPALLSCILPNNTRVHSHSHCAIVVIKLPIYGGIARNLSLWGPKRTTNFSSRLKDETTASGVPIGLVKFSPQVTLVVAAVRTHEPPASYAHEYNNTYQRFLLMTFRKYTYFKYIFVTDMYMLHCYTQNYNIDSLSK